ncbi:MAG: DsbE family thiol:disulfide interchange protein [Alphaproteobacteria bacterium]|nr:DsbE family thiol:disulfide interchange protein [Alphaproteobacteria bacterium]
MTPRRLLTLLPLAVFLAVAIYFALALRPERDTQALPSAMIDKPVPVFDLPSLADGPNLSQAAAAGEVVVINYFASWCVPCRIEHPVLMALKAQKITLWGIAYKDKPEDSRKFLAQSGDPYTRIGVDRDGRIGFDFGVYGVPETYVIDRAGHIRKRFVGPLSREIAEHELLPLVRALAKP